MKRYLLFYGKEHNKGGWNDFQGSFETIELARLAIPQNKNWFQIIFMEDFQVIISQGV